MKALIFNVLNTKHTDWYSFFPGKNSLILVYVTVILFIFVCSAPLIIHWIWYFVTLRLFWCCDFISRFSLTLWQGSIHPNISDLLFIRDNTHPARVYYDIYEPTLSEFKKVASKKELGKTCKHQVTPSLEKNGF